MKLFADGLLPIFVLLSSILALSNCQYQASNENQLQCYACGLPKVHPENDIVGSYGTGVGKKRYNHSCLELKESMDGDKIDNGFLRTCPVGVKSCFGAFGKYDHEDNDPSNDLEVSFLGCSEAKYKHSYGCDTEQQNVDVRNKNGTKVQVEIEVTLCFCSKHTCNHPNGDLMSSSSTSVAIQRTILTLILTAFGISVFLS